MSTWVLLQYQWVRGNLSSGSVCVMHEDRQEKQDFENLDFRPMMQLFAKGMIAHPEAEGIILRSDRANIPPLVLSETQAARLRTDPLQEIKALDILPVISNKVPLKGIVRFGLDTLADSFGEQLFCYAKSNKIECPVCGNWAIVETEGFKCTSCLTALPCGAFKNKWRSIYLPLLLATGKKNFFLPRAWNKTPPWVSREELTIKYLTFKKDIENV